MLKDPDPRMVSLEALNPGAVTLLRRHGLLEPLVRAEVVAEAVADVRLTPEEETQALEQFCAKQKLGNEDALAAFLDKEGLSQRELLWKLTLPVRVKRHSQEHFRHKAEARFLERKHQLDRVVYSMLRVRDGFLARELYLRISEGEANFADLAAEYSQGKERNTKGIVGPVPLMQAHPVLAEMLRTSKPGELRQPFQLEDWFLVVRLEAYQPASLDPGTEAQMAMELFEQWAREQSEPKVSRLISAGLPSATA